MVVVENVYGFTGIKKQKKLYEGNFYIDLEYLITLNPCLL